MVFTPGYMMYNTFIKSLVAWQTSFFSFALIKIVDFFFKSNVKYLRILFKIHMLHTPFKFLILFELLKMKKTCVKALCFYSETKAGRSLTLSAKPQVHTICQKYFCNIMVREIESRLQTAEALKRIVRIIWFSPSWSFVLHNAQCPFHERLLIKCNKFLTSAPSFHECKVGDAQLRCSAAAKQPPIYINCSRIESPGLRSVCARAMEGL